MTQINYKVMTDRELKDYMLSHRDDRSAFQAYLDCRHDRPDRTVIQPDDPNWEQKVLAVMQAQLHSNSSEK
jgi:hypothetical protein